MRYKTVRYERLKKHDTESFENERYGVEIELEDGDDADAAMAAAKVFVNRQLGDGLTIEDAQAQIDELVDAGVSAATVEAVARELSAQVAGAGNGTRRFDMSEFVHQRRALGQGERVVGVPDPNTDSDSNT